MAQRTIFAADRTIRRYLLGGVATCILLVGGAGSLAAVTELSGAVIASGKLVVDSSVKKVQHPTGGVVGQIFVREGDAVQSGKVLIRLDETITRANLAIVTKSLDEFEARLARLEVERDGKGSIIFPASLVSRQDAPEVGRAMAGEQSLFEFRRQARAGQKAQLEERIAQLAEEVSGLTEQRDAKSQEIKLIGFELEGMRILWQRKLVSIDRITALERDAVRLKGEHGQLTASIAQAKGRIAETRLQIIQIDQDLRSEVASELRDVQAKISEFVERKVSAEDQLKRIDIRSPQNGVVHQLGVHTVGGVISPGELIMLIVPVTDDLTVEARVAPQDIDQLTPGQSATLRLSAFNQQTTPELNGAVSKISADLNVDEKTGASFYTVHVVLPRTELTRLKGLALAPGMPVEVFFSTGNRTMLSYLVKPLADQIQRAFREE
ncbi:MULTISPECIES: HlyD family type I secretion periplasmic adaptor subunit [unclassified Mesorhizobium]|uniref:HlyD family type I secretion periplasmic adaptor subunit n=1 Tax=unclassified Mesorhizobium TaxID=325217 RepID=UPI000FE8FB8F|nr:MULTISPECIES: HlyD family type I secretion periplasmic adaptor subunit [unclassified Mesorhizobium]RWC24647.1 MAG: HlyD family type I secretion periplasmic adaptor subunit [Mesorhizobium sp.]RWE57078.1 MAG: HlyD family type I secretion periplasmic adaptor subunit [Mesorhizobium sp.]RWF04240.1 MAG: HlyD family type I secretion periplasmic adaptor subunit [Mesorhizobium sp.]RWF53859.1 MAG: HlyD family type I secretion periplasmic adaptor subunit [Mesorhizobium sp.]TGT95389.1 HlyD family type 